MKKLSPWFLACVLASGCHSGGAQKETPKQGGKPTAKGPKKLPVGPNRGPGQKDPLAGAKKKAQGGDLAGAIGDVRAVLKERPNHEEGYALLSALCAMNGDRACAAKALDDGIASLPRSWTLHHSRGMLRLEAQDVEGAVKDLESAKELSAGKSAEVLSDLAYAYIFVSRLDEAEAIAREARTVAPKSFAAAYVHGEILLRQKRAKEAIEAYEAAINASPNEVIAHRRLAKAKNMSGDHDGALAIYDRLIEKLPTDSGLRAEAAGALMNLDRAKDAVKYLKAAIEISPDQKRLYEFLLQAQKAAGDKKGAKRTKKKLKSLKGK